MQATHNFFCTCNLKFSSCRKKKGEKQQGKLNLITFYLTQYMQNITQHIVYIKN